MSNNYGSSKRIKLDQTTYYQTPVDAMDFGHIEQLQLKPFAPTVEEFIEHNTRYKPLGEYVNIILPDDETVLTHCIKHQFVEAVEELIIAGADPNLSSRKGVTPISAAAHKGNIRIMEKLMMAGAAVNAINQSGSTALIQAAHFGHVPAVKLLLRYNASSDFANVKGTTALMRACQEGHLEISRLLVGSDVDVNRKNHEGMNALMLASQRGHADIVTLLIRHGASMDEQTTQGSTALMLACKRGHKRCAEVLVCMGAEIWMKDRRGRTARDTATRRNHLELLCWLDTQVQVQKIQSNRQLLRHSYLMQFREAALRGKLQLNPVDSTVGVLCSVVQRRLAGSTLSLFRSRTQDEDDMIMEGFLNSSPDLPFTAASPLKTVDIISAMCTNDINATIAKIPVFRNSSKLSRAHRGFAEWQWSSLLFRCMSLPPGVFEHLMDFVPSPRVWQWTLTRVRLRCRLNPRQAMLDISHVMDEILADMGLLCDPEQKHMLVKVSRTPQIHDYLVEEHGMSPEMVDSLCHWAEVQGMLRHHGEEDVDFKYPLAKQMLIAAIALYKWYRGRQSAVKRLGLVLPSQMDASTSDGIDGLNSLRLNSCGTGAPDSDESDLMEETDAGGEGSDNDGDDGAGNNAVDANNGDGGQMVAGNMHDMAAQDAADDDDDENLQLGDSDDEMGGVAGGHAMMMNFV